MEKGEIGELLPHAAERSVAEFLDDRCPQLAAAIAYHVLFSLFPLAIMAAGISGIVLRATGRRADVVDAIASYVPLSADGDQGLRRLLEGATGSLSALGLLGAVGLVYAASGMMASIRIALNAAWDVDEVRPFLRGKIVDVALVAVTSLFVLAAFGVTVGVRAAGGGWSSWILGVVVPFLTSFGVALFVYRVVPAADVRFRDAWPGAFVAAAVFVLLENLFAVYVGHFADYNAVYGSLGGVIAFMFFVYLSSLGFLLGAETASEWRPAVERVAAGRVPEGPPLTQQIRDVLRGLWVRRRQQEADRS